MQPAARGSGPSRAGLGFGKGCSGESALAGGPHAKHMLNKPTIESAGAGTGCVDRCDSARARKRAREDFPGAARKPATRPRQDVADQFFDPSDSDDDTARPGARGGSGRLAGSHCRSSLRKRSDHVPGRAAGRSAAAPRVLCVGDAATAGGMPLWEAVRRLDVVLVRLPVLQSAGTPARSSPALVTSVTHRGHASARYSARLLCGGRLIEDLAATDISLAGASERDSLAVQAAALMADLGLDAQPLPPVAHAIAGTAMEQCSPAAPRFPMKVVSASSLGSVWGSAVAKPVVAVARAVDPRTAQAGKPQLADVSHRPCGPLPSRPTWRERAVLRQHGSPD